MQLDIRPYSSQDEPQVAAFNQRLRRAGAGYQFPPRSTPAWLPPVPGRPLYQEYFLAIDPQGEVRGGYILKHQEFLVHQQLHTLADYQLPLSEGIIDPRFNFVGLRLLANALSRQRLLFALGMGGFDEPLVRMLLAMRWRAAAVPFYFRVMQPYRFLRNITHLRRRRPLRLACDLAAMTGLGWLAIKALHGLQTARRVRDPDVLWTEVTDFGDWADRIWDRARSAYHLIAVRNRQVLEILYGSSAGPNIAWSHAAEDTRSAPSNRSPSPHTPERFIRLLVTRSKEPVGWAVLLATQMQGHKHFGNMKVGTLVDCLALPGQETAVVSAATHLLGRRGVDLMVSNQAHRAWQAAMRRCGWLHGPSNFLFAASPALVRLLGPWDGSVAGFHLNRGDGDGPINL